MLQQSVKERIEEVERLYGLAKRHLSQLETIEWGDATIVPVLNELRYVGEHILRATSTEEEEKALAEIEKAELHCWRAIFDSTDTVGMISLSKLNQFQEEFHGLIITEYVPEYSEVVELARQIRSLLLQKKSGDITNRYEYYERLNQYLPELIHKLQRIEESREILLAALRKEQSRTKSWLIAILASIATSIGAGLVASSLFDTLSGYGEQESTIQNEIQNLSNVQASLESLQEYVATQQDRLENLNSDIGLLSDQREQLEAVVELEEQAVQQLISVYESNRPLVSWFEIIVSFVVGSLSSLFIVFLVGFLKKRKIIEST